jgi:general secretion pathway protein G
MHYRCPYCRTNLGEQPVSACPSCGKRMLVATRRTPEDRRKRQGALYRIDRDAQAKLAEIREAPNPRAFYSPRVLLGALLLMGCIGSLLIGRANRRAREPEPGIPHRRALRDLDVIATALGRYRFHVGRWPAPQPHGLLSLCNDYREPGWIGPYIRHLRNDPWQNPYQYVLKTNDSVRVFSMGPDGVAGTPDDLGPDPAAFDIGTAWTNNWVPAIDRLPGVRIHSSPQETVSP